MLIKIQPVGNVNSMKTSGQKDFYRAAVYLFFQITKMVFRVLIKIYNGSRTIGYNDADRGVIEQSLELIVVVFYAFSLHFIRLWHALKVT